MRIVVLIFIAVSLFAQVGIVGSYQGDVKVLRDAKVLHVKSGFILEKNDKIKTATSSKVQLLLDDDSVITIGEDSELAISDFLYDEETQNALELELSHGFFRTLTGKIGKLAPERFKLKTRSATIGIRGTDFGVFVANDVERVGCFSGVITVTTDTEQFELDKDMMVELFEGVWQMHKLDVSRFKALLAHDSSVDLFESDLQHIDRDASFNDLLQQDRLNAPQSNITPGFEVVETTPPPFVP